MTTHLVATGEPDFTATGHDGSWVLGEGGERYLDLTSGAGVANLGWNHPALETQWREFSGPDYVSPQQHYPGWEELAALLVQVAPGSVRRCFRATGGSEAVDLALQAARLHTERRTVLSLAGSYHGNTLAGIDAASGSIRPPLDGRALARVERRLARENVAAVILEPIAINLGVLIPEKGFMRGLQRACRATGTLLIADEVACGCGRTGRLFASEHFGLRPDIVCVAKAVTNGMAPLGAMLCSVAVAKTMQRHGKYYSTFGWHPRSVHAALVTLRHLVSHGKSLYEAAEAISGYCCERLHRARWGDEVEIRARGPAIAVALGDPDRAKRIQRRALRQRLLVSTEHGAVVLLPPLTTTRSQMEQALDILETCID